MSVRILKCFLYCVMNSTQTNSNVKLKYHLALDALFLLMQDFTSYIFLGILADYSFPFWLCGCVSCMMILSATALKQNFHSHFHQISADVSHSGVNHISVLENSSHRRSPILYYICRNNRIIALMTRTNAGNDWYTCRWGISNVFSKRKKKVKFQQQKTKKVLNCVFHAARQGVRNVCHFFLLSFK